MIPSKCGIIKSNRLDSSADSIIPGWGPFTKLRIGWFSKGRSGIKRRKIANQMRLSRQAGG
jgi:hypothetical protein